MRYQVELDGGQALLVRSHNRADHPDYRPGARVGVSWDPADAIVLR